MKRFPLYARSARRKRKTVRFNGNERQVETAHAWPTLELKMAKMLRNKAYFQRLFIFRTVR